MFKVRVCFEVADIATDEHGNLKPVGVQICLGESVNEIPYEELIKHVDIEKVAYLFLVPPSRLTIITPQEYDERYGDKEALL